MIQQCCGNTKLLAVKIKTPEGEQIYHVCAEHKSLEYFVRYKISEAALS